MAAYVNPRRRVLWAGLLAALVALALLAAPPPAVRAAPPQPETWAAEWSIIGSGAAPEGTLGGLRRSPAGPHITIVPGVESGTYESPVRDMGRDFVALGALYRATAPGDAEVILQARLSADGSTWGPWQTLEPDEAAAGHTAEGARHTDLLLDLGRYVQARAILNRGALTTPRLEMLKLVAIDSRQGPTAEEAAGAGRPVTAFAAAAPTPPAVISRADWGANEAWMTWDPEYAPVSHFVIHHTATANGEVDPAATVRAVYYYHAVTLGWGDIGYNYVIDRFGRIYEGRKGGDGVIGAHAKQFNPGTVGLSIVGDYTSVDVPAPAVSALVELLAWKGNLHAVHPLTSSQILNVTLPHIMGHRDCNQTTCPGTRGYAILPQVRTATYERMRAIPPHLAVARPAAGEHLSGTVQVAWQASPAAGGVTVAVDGRTRETLAPGVGTWQWDTAAEADGEHLLRLSAGTDLGQSTAVEVKVSVDNAAPTGSLSAPAFTNATSVTLTLACSGCTRMQFGAGWRWQGEDLYHAAGSGHAVADAAAANGRAWQGRAASDVAGPWYGPYDCALPFPASYQGVFWLRAVPGAASARLADLDVVDQQGTRILAGKLPVLASDFRSGAAYQPFTLSFQYPDRGSACARAGVADGLELRTAFLDAADLWLDRVEVYTAPEPLATAHSFPLPAAEGPHPVEVRYLDEAGNASPLYATTVTVDRTPPAWGEPGPGGLPIRDALSGLDAASAAYALSADGKVWGKWVPAQLSLAGGGLTGVLPAQVEWGGRYVRARARDRAGNQALSSAVPWPAIDTPTPTATASGTPPTATATATPTATPIATATVRRSATPTGTLVPSATPTATATATRTATPSATATRTATATATPTATPMQPVCTEAVANGGFEADGSWTLPLTDYRAARTDALAHSGAWSMRIGAENWWANRQSYSSAYQWLDIPAGVRSATLRLCYYAASGDWGDRQYIILYDEAGNPLIPWVLDLLPARSDGRWHSLERDVTAYAGRHLKLLAGVYNNGYGGLARLYIDDVSLEACSAPPPATATSTPPATATATATATASATPTRTPAMSATPTPTGTRTVTPTPSATPTPTGSRTVTPTPSATPRPRRTPTPGGLVTNGGFEADGGWALPNTACPAGYSDALAHSGRRALRLGLTWGQANAYSFSSAAQDVALPAGARSATLRFWYYPLSSDVYDSQRCWVLDAGGRVLATPLQLYWPDANGQAWRQATCDLTPYLGQTVRLYFQVYNNGAGGVSALYVDDVSIQVTP